MIEKLEIDSLCKFLIKAKQNSYAKHGERSEPKCILSKNYLYIEGDYRYEDQYFGEYLDVGEEIVWYKEIPVWGMGYRGGMRKQYRGLKEETFILLRKALLMPDENFPTRGPCFIEQGAFKYTNHSSGDITSFTGSEFIERDNEKIYFRNYIGGLIFGKHNVKMDVIY